MRYIGLDAGSVSVKLVELDGSGKKLQGHYRKHRGHPIETALAMLGELPTGQEYSVAVTGSAGRLIADIMGMDAVNEIVAQAYATRKLLPEVKSIIELGGEDSKLIVMGEDGLKDFAMNSVCAAGTGSFLDQQAERLRLNIEEFSKLALKSETPPRIAGRCSVFAKSDMIHLQQIATPVEDIVAGLCFAVARNFKGAIVRGRVIDGPVSFQGGVAANQGMVRAFREVFGLPDLIVPGDFALMGALGAAMKALDENVVATLDTAALAKYLSDIKSALGGHRPLRDESDGFHERHLAEDRNIVFPVNGGAPVDAYMGIDIGSISTNVAIMDREGKLLSKRYLMTAGRPIEAVRQGLREVDEEVGAKVRILGVGTTGSGRYMISDYVGADIVKNEITAQATAAAFIDKSVDTIFEIGGQDSKYISLRDGVIVDFEMNKACAAGTGSFLEEQAEKLNISVKGEFADCAFGSDCPSRLGERCTVFMENSLMANLQKGAPKDDLLAGLAYSIVQNYINRVVAGKPIGRNIFFQGGVAFNKSVVAAFEKHVGVEVTVPPNHDVTGAIGMALIAMRHHEESGYEQSSFKGFERVQTPYHLKTFGCKSCSNMCEINRVIIEGEDSRMFYGGRCEKYDISRKDTSHIPNLFKFRDEQLRKHVTPPRGGRPLIGLPYTFFMSEFLPFWCVLLEELGFDVELSPAPDRAIIDMGLQGSISEACFPVKVSLGHLKHLREKGVTDILLPSYINLHDREMHRSVVCPHTQSIPYVGNVAVEGLNMLAPVIDTTRGDGYLAKELRRVFASRGIGMGRIRRAMAEAERAQDRFYQAVRARGREVLAGLTERAVVIIGRAYNAFERGVNLQIPEKLATLGVLAIPMDMLPVEDVSLLEDWPSMYWRSGQRIMRAAKYVKGHDMLYPIFIGNFSCGPDSFILKYFAREMAPKPYLHIEIDEHSADAGAITRCEAFLDSIENQDVADFKKTLYVLKGNGAKPDITKRTIYVPLMTDHSLAVVAAFQRAGARSEIIPESDPETVEVGMRHASGKECFPCVATTGDMVKLAQTPGFDPDKAAFFMPSGQGPCRFGQYNVFHKQVLEKIGMKDVPVYAPNQDYGLFKDLGIVGSEFSMNSWRGIVGIELLFKSLCETRPYELDRGASDALYTGYLTRVFDTLRDASRPIGDLEKVLVEARDAFASVRVDRTEPRPLIGVVGELYVRLNRFSNEDLVRKIEEMGGEVWLSPIEEWIHYISETGLRRAWRKLDVSVIVDSYVKHFFMGRVTKQYGRLYEGYLKRLHEPTIREVIRKAEPYVHETFEGEAVLSVGKAVDLAEHGACGIVNAMPFGCMPGTVVSAIFRAVSRDQDIPCISMPYDGSESSTTYLQLEAFMEQAKAKMRSKSLIRR